MGAYVAQVDRVLALGRACFRPRRARRGGVVASRRRRRRRRRSGLNVGVDRCRGALSGNWSTVSGAGRPDQRWCRRRQGRNERGRSGATGVRARPRTQAAAIAPATGSPAGVKLLVSSMDERLAAMEREITTTKAQNRLLATRLRQSPTPTGRPSGPPAPTGWAALRAMTCRGFGGLAAGCAHLGGLGGIPPMSAISALAGRRGRR